MPGTRGGTGHPLVFKCAKCKLTGFGHESAANPGKPVPTGRVRERFSGRGSGRISGTHQYEYRCGECGHVGWTRHKDMKP